MTTTLHPSCFFLYSYSKQQKYTVEQKLSGVYLMRNLVIKNLHRFDSPIQGNAHQPSFTLYFRMCFDDITLCGFRLEGEAYVHYKAMLISLALHLILLMFELLVCDKLQTGRHLWILVFIPLIFISIVSIAVCIWAVKHDRSFEVSKSSQLFYFDFQA